MEYNIEVWFVKGSPHPVETCKWEKRPVIFYKEGFKIVTELYFEELADLKADQVFIRWEEIELLILEKIDENEEGL